MLAEQQLNIEFVQEVEKYPCLYNSNLPEYMRKYTTEKVWGEIGEKFTLSVPECKERWKNLRSVFTRHLRHTKSGSPTSKRKPYYLADYMTFAIPFIKMSINNLTEETRSFSEEQSQYWNFLDEPFSLTNKTESQPLPSTSSARSQSQSRLPSTQQVTSESQQEQPISRLKQICETEKAIANYFKTKQAKIAESLETAEQGANKMFLLSILPDMNKMDDKKRRSFKRRMLELVDEIMEQEEDYDE